MRHLLWTILLASGLVWGQAHLSENESQHRPDPTAVLPLPSAQDFSNDAKMVRDRGLPMMLAVVTRECGYCTLLKNEFIRPMIISGDYVDKVIIRTLDISRDDDVTDFNGAAISPEDFASNRGVIVTPTVLFLDDKGKELQPRMIGINTIDYYGAYLDEAIDKSRAVLRSRPGIARK
ncbi:MAG: hypothetical protein BMS9Abin26_0421 [Gammaproteobacteria bacterium]|nr:MAG: hypothetical protein BMS9Abin26_0421 [Gammaproteobacteria bacterium]